MRVGFVGAGRIGGNLARLLRAAGHETFTSFSRDPATVDGTPAEAAAFGDVVVLSVPWTLVETAVEEAGGLAGKVVIDTTNQFGAGGWEEIPDGLTAAQLNQRRMPGARLVKAFNTLTAAFQAEAAGRTGPDRVAIFMCGDDAEAKAVVAGLIDDAGFVPIDVGGLADATPMEAPRRPGAVYGEEYHEADAREFLERLREGA
jgi:8-hydroxy-5-deazaflavin:NADPH oxidoreductase